MNIAPFLAACDVMTTVIQQISPSKPHEALNPTYHPRYPSSALPFDTPTSFSARRSTHGKNMAVWTGECLPDRQPGRLWRADSLSSHFYRYIAKIGWNEVAILSLYVGFTYRGRNVLAHGSVCIFSLPFFCLSIIFVQPYAGFVCQKEQGPTVTAYQWWALPPFPFLPLHPQDREERSRYPVSEKMDRTLRGCLTMCLSFTLSYHPALGVGCGGDHNGCR